MAKIIGKSFPDMPWQDKPQGFDKPVWRYDHNPIIPRDLIPTSNSIFNSAVVPFEGKYAGVFRCDNRGLMMDIFAGFSDDGINWNINHDPIVFEPAPGCDPCVTRKEYRYDPRVCFIEDRYYITTASTARRSAWATPTISRPFISLRMRTCPTTATAFCSRERSAITSRC